MRLPLIENTNKKQHDEQTINKWKKLTISANNSCREGNLFYANCLYEKAAEKAKQLFVKLACNKDSISILIISFRNLAYFHLTYNNRRYVRECLCELIHCLNNRLKQNLGDEDDKAALSWGITQAKQQLWIIENTLKCSSLERELHTIN